MNPPLSTEPLLQRARRPAWSIGIYTGPTPLALSPPAQVANPVLTADAVTDCRAEFVADPFLVREDGRWYLFFEIMPCGSMEGVIGLAESSDGLHWDYRQVVLREPFHLSYPCVFSWRGDYYMTPESLTPQQVRLYRAVRFPNHWEHVADLAAGYHADPTVFQAGDGWWMFSCTSPNAHATLRLYYAEGLFCRWVEHPRSPVVEHNSRLARPAGRVIAWDGDLLRFAQDCYPRYGIQVHAIRITSLTRTAYREELAQQGPVIGPFGGEWNRLGMHHVDVHRWPEGGWIAAVDAR